jgi:hypothetical protein
VDVRGDEERVIVAFCAWLQENGWTNIRREVEFVDIVAEQGGQTLYVEAKGQTSSPGLDIDTMYGQLLRRMQHPEALARYAVVVPSSAVQAALRVPDWNRERLKVDVYAVDLNGGVARAGLEA